MTRKIDSGSLREIAITGCSIVEMSAHFDCAYVTVRRGLRRYGLLHEWSKQRRKQHVCEHCAQPSADRFCSQKCWGYANRKEIDAGLLAPYVEKGATLLSISAELKIHRNLVRAELIRHGLHKSWANRRYKKCAVAA